MYEVLFSLTPDPDISVPCHETPRLRLDLPRIKSHQIRHLEEKIESPNILTNQKISGLRKKEKNIFIKKNYFNFIGDYF